MQRSILQGSSSGGCLSRAIVKSSRALEKAKQRSLWRRAWTWFGELFSDTAQETPPLALPNPESEPAQAPNTEKTLNDTAREFIEYYCQLPAKQAPGYAVLVTGEWGSGKTHLVHKILRRHDEKDKQVPHLYVSLYGMTKVSEIGVALFQELHPVLSSKTARVAAQLGKGLLRATVKVDLDGDGKDDMSLSPQLSDLKLSKEFQNAGEKILVFDDLERTDIPVVHALGYINSFVEHEGCKAILIANEEKLLAQERKELHGDQKSDYEQIKEKLIGQTLAVKPEFENALSKFLLACNDHALLEQLERHRETISELFWRSDTKNLRILRASLLNFERFVGAISKEHRDRDALMNALLRIFLVLSFEHRSPRLTADDLRRFHRHSGLDLTQTPANHAQQATPAPPTQPEKRPVGPLLEERYPGVVFDDSVLSYPLWADILFEGQLDAEAIAKELSTHSLCRGKEPEPSWRVLWYSHASDADLEDAVADLEKGFAERRYEDVREVLQVVGVRLWLARIQELAPKTLEEVTTESIAYIDDLLQSRRLEPRDVKEPYEDLTAFGGLGFRELDTSEFERVSKHLSKSRKQALTNKLQSEAPRLLETMKNGGEAFYVLLCHTNSSENLYADVPILHHIPCDEFVEAVLALPRDALMWIRRMFSGRYRANLPQDIVDAEFPWLRDVTSQLRSAAAAMKPIPRDFFHTLIEATIQPTLNRYGIQNGSEASE